MIWLQHPSTRGALWMYNYAIRQWWIKNRDITDKYRNYLKFSQVSEASETDVHLMVRRLQGPPGTRTSRSRSPEKKEAVKLQSTYRPTPDGYVRVSSNEVLPVLELD